MAREVTQAEIDRAMDALEQQAREKGEMRDDHPGWRAQAETDPRAAAELFDIIRVVLGSQE